MLRYRGLILMGGMCAFVWGTSCCCGGCCCGGCCCGGCCADAFASTFLDTRFCFLATTGTSSRFSCTSSRFSSTSASTSAVSACSSSNSCASNGGCSACSSFCSNCSASSCRSGCSDSSSDSSIAGAAFGYSVSVSFILEVVLTAAVGIRRRSTTVNAPRSFTSKASRLYSSIPASLVLISTI